MAFETQELKENSRFHHVGPWSVSAVQKTEVEELENVKVEEFCTHGVLNQDSTSINSRLKHQKSVSSDTASDSDLEDQIQSPTHFPNLSTTSLQFSPLSPDTPFSSSSHYFDHKPPPARTRAVTSIHGCSHSSKLATSLSLENRHRRHSANGTTQKRSASLSTFLHVPKFPNEKSLSLDLSKVDTSPSGLFPKQGSSILSITASHSAPEINQLPTHSNSHQEPTSSRPLSPNRAPSPKIQVCLTSPEGITTPSLTRPYSENPLKETWIMDQTWLCVSDPDSPLSEAESLFSQQRYQAGLARTDIALRPSTSKPSPNTTFPSTPNQSQGTIHSQPKPQPRRGAERTPQITYGTLTHPSTISLAKEMNIHLIRSCALLACSYPDLGLEAADRALTMSEEKGIWYMVCKSQLYRGMCLMGLKRWKEASWACMRSANVRGWGSRGRELKEVCEREIRKEKWERREEKMWRRGERERRRGLGMKEMGIEEEEEEEGDNWF